MVEVLCPEILNVSVILRIPSPSSLSYTYLGVWVYYSVEGSTSTYATGYRLRISDTSASGIIPFASTDDDWVTCKFNLNMFQYNPSGFVSIVFSEIDAASDTTGTIQIRDVKVELGESHTSWCPAPEDTADMADSIDTLNSDYKVMVERISSAEQKITSEAIVSTVASSQTYKTLVENVGNAQTTANNAVTAASNAQSTANSAKSTADSAVSSVSILERRVSTAEQKITADAIVNTVRGSTSYQLDFTGGANLIRNGGFETGNLSRWSVTNWTGDGDVVHSNVNKRGNAWDWADESVNTAYVTCKSSNGSFGLLSDNIRVQVGKTYTVSGYVAAHRTNGYLTVIPYNYDSGSISDENRPAGKSFTTTTGGNRLTGYTRFAYSFVSTCSNIRLNFRTTGSSDATSVEAFLWLAQLQLEEGSQATAYKPCAQDLEDRVSSAEQKITADAIISTVKSSSAYTDESGNIKTASCDTRVFSSMEIDSLPPSGTTWSQLVLAAVGDANAAASAAASGSSVAQASAAQAAQAASTAETSKQNAAQSASASATSAQQASGSAQAASASAKTASDKAASASTSESNAKNSESAARDSASVAASSATAAQGSATAAASSASSAQASANNASQNASAALSSKNSATHSATNAAASAQQAAQSEQRAQALFDSFHDKLCNAQIYDTKETASFDAEGRIVQIIHSDNTTGETVRTDVFTYAGSMITETRTLPTGEKQVNVYDMTSFVFQYDVQEGTT